MKFVIPDETEEKGFRLIIYWISNTDILLSIIENAYKVKFIIIIFLSTTFFNGKIKRRINFSWNIYLYESPLC